MRILGVEPYSRTPGHFSWVATRTCEGLARRGHDTTLLTYGGILEGAYSGVPPFRVIAAAARLTGDPDVTRIGGKLRGRSLRSLGKRFVLQWRTLRRAFSLLAREHYDVIYVFDGHPLVLLLAVRLCGKRSAQNGTVLVLNLHYPERLSRRWGLRWFLADRLYRKALLSLLLRGRVGVRVADPWFKEKLTTCLQLDHGLSERVVLVPHGADSLNGSSDRAAARRRLRLNFEETIFLIFGTLRKNKRYDIVMQAMVGLSGVRLLIVGPPLDLDETALDDLLRGCGCEGSVAREIRFVDEARMRDYFLAADAVIVAYSKSFIGSSGVLMHACTCGRSVIASAVGVIGQTVKENGIGFVVEPENPEALRRAMQEFRGLSPEERAGMEQRARALARKESWDITAVELETFFARLAK